MEGLIWTNQHKTSSNPHENKKVHKFKEKKCQKKLKEPKAKSSSSLESSCEAVQESQIQLIVSTR